MNVVSSVLVTSLLVVSIAGFAAVSANDTAGTSPRPGLGTADRGFLFAELARIEPPERIRELASYSQRQSALGGGFYGMMPDQLAHADSVPVPVDSASTAAAAEAIALQRRQNLAALEAINPEYPRDFRGGSLEAFLEAMPGGIEPMPESRGLRLHLDCSAIEGFFDAWSDGEVTAREALDLASLPSNQAMLSHRRNLGYVPEPLPDTESLATLIAMAGSRDPLDRLWCWMSSQNAFDYADLVQNEEGYRRLLGDLDEHGDELVAAALARVGRFAPADVALESTFAFTVGWAIRGWATPGMAGLNVEQVKDDWEFLFGTLVEETYHRLQLELFASSTEGAAKTFEDLLTKRSGDEGLDRLFELVATTVAEGAANRVRGPFAAEDLAAEAPLGAELVERFVREVVTGGEVGDADALLSEGLRSNGPLYGLGWALADAIVAREGERALGEWQQRGPVPFFLHAAALAADGAGPTLDPRVIAAVERLR